MKWVIIRPSDEGAGSARLRQVWDHVLGTAFYTSSVPTFTIHTAEELAAHLLAPAALTGCRVLFLIALGKSGVNLTLYRMLRLLRLHPGCLEDSAAGMIVDGETELYTKAAASELALALTMAGCTLIGKGLVEGTGSLYNFTVAAKNLGCGLMEAYKASAADLAVRLMAFRLPRTEPPRILCIHSSSRATSNTLQLWELVKEGISPGAEIKEISLRNGEVRDCAGCSFETCLYFSKSSGCYYGGSIVEEVYPALEWCSHLVLLCPNYNDALGANLTAFINRLTSLFRKKPFFEKQLFALIVSGYSGSDLVARQLIDGLSMNKAFITRGNFALMASANLPGSVGRIPGIAEKAAEFGRYLSS